jgi:phosphate transport system permease protein
MSITIVPDAVDPEPTSFEPMTARRMTRPMQLAIAVLAVIVGVALAAVLGGVHPVRVLFYSAPVFLLMQYVASRSIEGSRRATDRTVTAVVTGAFLVVLVPLVSLIWTVIERGSTRMDVTFFTSSMRNVVGEGGGIHHALIGTLVVTALATLFSVPFGLFAAIYLVEYGPGSRIAKWITMLVDVMTGIPSIVAGLFAYSLFVIFQGAGARSGLAGAVALTVLMTPVVVRSSEEMLRLIQDELREASFALGVPKWRTITKVVLPTAIGGILTGITLAIARVIGETAPLLVTAGLAQDTNWNPLGGRMTTLPVQAYYSYTQPTLPPQLSIDRAWGAALVLIIVVAILFSLARIMAMILKPKGLR